MMRPSTAKAMQQKREANRMQAREAREDVENDLMIISSMELNKQQSKESRDIPLPRYRSMKVNINDESKDHEGGNAYRGKAGSALGNEQPSSARGDGAKALRNPYGAKTGSASKRDTTFGGNSNQSTAHQPRQKRLSTSRPGTASHTKPKTGAIGARNGTKKDSKTDSAPDKEGYSVSGVSMMTSSNANRYQKTSMRNNDICDELILSKEGMRFDQKLKDAELESQRKDELMREAEAALAQTDAVLQTRKDALVAKHLEGRESLHELDYIFRDPKFDLDAGGNYLDQHRREMQQRDREQEQLRADNLTNERKSSTINQQRSDLFKWNLQTDDGLNLDQQHAQTTKDQDVDFVNLNIGSGRKEGEGVVGASTTAGPAAAVPGRVAAASTAEIEEREEKKASFRPARHYSPDSEAYSDEVEAAGKKRDHQTNNSNYLQQRELLSERQKMLEMIKHKQKMQFQPTAAQSEAEVLNGIGDGILKDLESSIQESREQEPARRPAEVAEDPRKESTIGAFTSAPRSLRSQRDDAKDVIAAEQREAKKVHFAESTSRSNQVEASGGSQRRKSSSESDDNEQTNKLAELNNLLKQKDFKFKEDDENEFETFLKELQQKRQQLDVQPAEPPRADAGHAATLEAETAPIEADKFYQRQPEATPPRYSARSKPAAVLEDAQEAQSSDKQAKKAADSPKEDREAVSRSFDEDMDSILQMKPGNYKQNLLVGNFMPPAKKEPAALPSSLIPEKRPSAGRAKRQTDLAEETSLAVVVREPASTPAPEKSEKVNKFMKFMDEIEEEMSSQYSQSAPRTKKTEATEHRAAAGGNAHDRYYAAQKANADSKPDAFQIDSEAFGTASVEQAQQQAQNYGSGALARQVLASELPEASNQQVRERMMELEIEREEQQKALQLLQEVRQKEREELNRAIAEAHQEGGQYADQVRNEMAARIEKQVQMIEALLEDKRALQESVEKVTEKAQDLQMAAEKQKKVLEERLHVELKKNREAWLAAEKVRKEKWEKDKVQEIRAQTVKGLEPEIQRIVERNKEDLRRAEEQHQIELRQKKEEILIDQERKFSQMREKLIREKEEALDQEREKSQQKLHDQYERLENQFNEERMRWKNNVYGEYDRLEALRKRDKDTLEEQVQTATQRFDVELQKETQKWEEKVEELQRKHQNEIKRMKEEESIAKEQWLESYQMKIDEQKRDYQKKVREEMVRERNREIEAIINKLGDETHDTQKQLLQQYERKVKDVEAKWKAEVEEYKVSIKQWKDKCQAESDARTMLDENLRVLGRRINDLELDIQEKKERLAMLRKEKEELVNVLDKIDHEHHGLRGELEDEMKLKLEDKQKELRHLKSELQSCEHKHALEVEQLKNSNRNDLEMIQEKVQMAMAKKKEIIDALHAETQMKDVQVIKLKEMLERQRRELLLGQ